MNLHNFIRTRLLRRAGLEEPTPPPKHELEDLINSEWSPEFERLMRNRLIMGALRYGTLEEKRKKIVKWDLLGALKSKAEMYAKTGNTEYLVDAANYCLLAFELDDHPAKHFHALDNHHDHCKVKK